MKNIIPGIIGKNFTEVKTKIAQVEGLTDWVQLDIMDGLFVPNYTWQTPDDLNDLGGKIKIEVHLMSESPENFINEWIGVADRVIFHLEATELANEIISQFESAPVKLGIALKLETPVEQVFPYLDKIDMVQLMSIAEIGAHGHDFESVVLNKIIDLRTKWPSGTISIDGGVNLESARQAFDAGADQVVVGSAIWESGNVVETIKQFQNL
jgi:ribulose-phosphate 3-epimerase